jgi:hypothetical protein
LRDCSRGKFDAFQQNAAWQKRIPQISAHLAQMSQVRPVLVYSGIERVSEDRLRLFEDLKRRFVDDGDYIEVQLCNLTTVYEWLIGADWG